jgi:hypothetical protein
MNDEVPQYIADQKNAAIRESWTEVKQLSEEGAVVSDDDPFAHAVFRLYGLYCREVDAGRLRRLECHHLGGIPLQPRHWHPVDPPAYWCTACVQQLPPPEICLICCVETKALAHYSLTLSEEPLTLHGYLCPSCDTLNEDGS